MALGQMGDGWMGVGFGGPCCFVEINRGRISNLVEQISPNDVPDRVIQDAGEDLGLILETVL